MEQDAGAIVERAVRRSGISIAELARRIDVDRRSIYYWFKQSSINMETIMKIGDAIDHDFSIDFPDLMRKALNTIETGDGQLTRDDQDAVFYWKHKYILLLEKYSDLLTKMNAER